MYGGERNEHVPNQCVQRSGRPARDAKDGGEHLSYKIASMVRRGVKVG